MSKNFAKIKINRRSLVKFSKRLPQNRKPHEKEHGLHCSWRRIQNVLKRNFIYLPSGQKTTTIILQKLNIDKTFAHFEREMPEEDLEVCEGFSLRWEHSLRYLKGLYIKHKPLNFFLFNFIVLYQRDSIQKYCFWFTKDLTYTWKIPCFMVCTVVLYLAKTRVLIIWNRNLEAN